MVRIALKVLTVLVGFPSTNLNIYQNCFCSNPYMFDIVVTFLNFFSFYSLDPNKADIRLVK